MSWKLVVALAAFGLLRPLLSMAGVLDALGKPWSPLAATAVIAVVWVGAVVWARPAQPVLTLTLAGVGYAVLAVLLNLAAQPLFEDARLVPGAGMIAMLVTNALWGAVLGVVAFGILRWTGRAR
ncbi:hypothetical protein B0I33_103593 [Prauserella shujinwangii]|uniref:Uncharacterized protein n=1 Tax=Prauserella shujinwangii TaxID=1453103 RepID=A0A2T0LZK9_9PSEU|nr:hypothetical protein [Prauserella shujinwangii]PRX49556.1 hypothetical protein B0I33_103593 [Prauserella shujinwangii]